MRVIDHVIVGHSGGGSARTSDVFDPNSGAVQAKVSLGGQAELDKAVAAAEAAQPAWADHGQPYERLIVRGQSNLLDTAGDIDRIRSLFDDLERKRDIAEFLDLAEQGDGVRIFIGSENKLFSLSGSSVVVSPYMNAERKIIGAIGVIGPTRLNYGRIVPIVDYTAQLVGRILSGRAKG